MTFARKAGGANVPLTTVKRRQGGAWVDVQTVKRRQGGTWVTVWQAYTPVSVSVTPDPSSAVITQTGAGAPASTTVAGALNVTAANGNGSYTYTVTLISGTAMTVTNGNTANPTIGINCGRNVTYSAVYRFTVSDGTTSAHQDVTVQRAYVWDSGA